MKKVAVMGMALPRMGTMVSGASIHCFSCGYGNATQGEGHVLDGMALQDELSAAVARRGNRGHEPVAFLL